MRVIARNDLGGTAINFTFCDEGGRFLVGTLCEYPARVLDGPDVCLQQIVDGLGMAANRHGVHLSDLSAVGLTPGPASASGVVSAAPGRDTVGVRGAALEALQQLRETEAGGR